MYREVMGTFFYHGMRQEFFGILHDINGQSYP